MAGTVGKDKLHRTAMECTSSPDVTMVRAAQFVSSPPVGERTVSPELNGSCSSCRSRRAGRARSTMCYPGTSDDGCVLQFTQEAGRNVLVDRLW